MTQLKDPGAPGESALLSLEASLARSRPLRVWSVTERARVLASAAASLDAWREAWGCPASPGRERLRCESRADAPGEAPAAAEWRPLGVRGLAWWFVNGRGRAGTGWALAQAELSRALVGTAVVNRGEKASIGAELVDAAWADLESRLGALAGGGAPTGAGDRPPRAVLGAWSGAVVLCVPWWDAELRVLLATEAVEPLAGDTVRKPAATPGGELVPVWRAIAARPVSLQVALSSFSLELGALASLRCGDVLRTAHPLDRPLDVMAGGEGAPPTPCCVAFMGRLEADRAVELAPWPRGTVEPSPPSTARSPTS